MPGLRSVMAVYCATSWQHTHHQSANCVKTSENNCGLADQVSTSSKNSPGLKQCGLSQYARAVFKRASLTSQCVGLTNEGKVHV